MACLSVPSKVVLTLARRPPAARPGGDVPEAGDLTTSPPAAFPSLLDGVGQVTRGFEVRLCPDSHADPHLAAVTSTRGDQSARPTT